MPDFYNCFIYHIARPKSESSALFMPCSSGYYTVILFDNSLNQRNSMLDIAYCYSQQVVPSVEVFGNYSVLDKWLIMIQNSIKRL